MEDRKGLNIAIVASLGLIIATWIFGSFWYSARLTNDSINVTGSAVRRITSDIGKWGGSFSVSVGTSNDELKTGNETLKLQTDEVKAFLKKNGLTDSEVTFDPVSVSPNYTTKTNANGDSSSDLSGYTLSTSFNVESKNLDAVAKAASATADLVGSGIILNSDPIGYYYSGLADLKVQMLAEATKDATARAQKIAENTNSSLGKLKSAQMGVMQITAPNSSDLSAEGYYDTSSKDKEITAIVRASFGIK